MRETLEDLQLSYRPPKISSFIGLIGCLSCTLIFISFGLTETTPTRAFGFELTALQGTLANGLVACVLALVSAAFGVLAYQSVKSTATVRLSDGALLIPRVLRSSDREVELAHIDRLRLLNRGSVLQITHKGKRMDLLGSFCPSPDAFLTMIQSISTRAGVPLDTR